jgi:hypothetical protein
VTETTVSTDLLEALKIVTELGVDVVGENLVVLAVDNVALSVEEPCGDLVLSRVLDDGDNSLELFRGELTGAAEYALVLLFIAFSPFNGNAIPLVQVDIGLLADQVGVTTSDTLDSGQGVHDLLFALNVCVKETQDLSTPVSQLLLMILRSRLEVAGIAGEKRRHLQAGSIDFSGTRKVGSGIDLRTGSSSSLPKPTT